MSASMIATIDGYQVPGIPENRGCCPPSLCNIDFCDFICSFMAFMPNGPLWDYWKRFRADQMRDYGDICELTGCAEEPACLTIIDHAIYTAKKLLSILQNPLQTAIWESSPFTAFVTRQNWLNSFGWTDCFEGPNTNAKLGFPTPYQAVCNKLVSSSLCAFETTTFQMSGDGLSNPNPVVNIENEVKAACPAPLALAVQYGILVALKRLQLGIVKNQEGINFVLAPLGAQMTMTIVDPKSPCIADCAPQMSSTPEVCVADCDQLSGAQLCTPYRPCVHITLSKTKDTIDGGPGITEPLRCETAKQALVPVPASYEFAGVMMPTWASDCPSDTVAGNGTIWPGLMAAECILVSILPTYLNYTLDVSTS